jgi:N-acyl-D-amino-acid deacylase
VRGGVIAALGDLTGAQARVAIPAAGRWVCPGFIDVHSHSDTYLLLEPLAPSKVFQGVTTEVVGNCGASAAPLAGAARLPSDWADKTYPGRWSRVAEFRALLDAARPAVNAVLLIGHNTLRAGVVGYEGRAAREDEVRAMAARLEAALDEGGRGLSTGLIYAPGMFAGVEEIRALAAVARSRDGLYTSHMRSEGRNLLAALRETLDIGRSTGVRVEVSHLKTSGKANWGLLDEALALIEGARAEGVEVCADRYPYTASCTDLDVVLPHWAAEGGREAVLQRLREPETRARIRADLLRERPADYWPSITVASTRHPDNRRFSGQALGEVAAALALEPVDAALHLIVTDELGTSAFFHGMSEANLWRILAQPWVMLGSDASLRSPEGPLSADYPHPRAYGSFPRFLRASLDGRTVPPEEAIRKMTSLPARHFRLRDRGELAVGRAADIAVLDPGTVADTATYAAPHRLATGLTHLVVNGVLTVADGRLTGERGGHVL